MINKPQTSDEAYFATDRLREVIDSMRTIWERSRKEINQDNPVDLYIVDADVVLMFMAPEMTHNYGALLRYEGHARNDTDSDMKTLEKRIVEFLGNLIFFRLRPNVPLFLMPDHADDLERILNGVGKDALKELYEWDNIRAAIKESGKSVVETSKLQLSSADDAVTENQKPQTIESLLELIFRSLCGDGDVGKLFRFDALTSSQRLCHIDRVPLQDELGQPCYFPSPIDNEGKYATKVSRLSDRLYQMMIRLSGTQIPGRRFRTRRDAQAFAHLTWLNELLTKESWYIDSGEGMRRRIGRLVLITGSHLLPQAISELDLRDLRESVFAPLSFLGHRLMDELMDEYVQRDLGRQRTIIEESTEGSQASALINFFDSMRALLRSAIGTKNENEISKALVKVREEHTKLIGSWQGRQLFGEHSRMGEVSSAIDDLEKSGRSLFALERFVETLSVEAWQSFARSVTMLSLANVSVGQAVQRNIPPVRLTHFPQAEQICGELYSTGGKASTKSHADAVLSKATISKLKKEDPSHYTEFVCYALYGLVNRMLLSAEGCVELALSIVESRQIVTENAKFIKGSEALYLLAYIVRLRARQRLHMDRAENTIELAIETSRQLSNSEDIRFESERFSIHSHQRYFECLGHVGRLHPLSTVNRDEKKLKDTFDEGFELLKRVKICYQNKLESGYVLEYVKQQLLVNLAQIGLHRVMPAARMGDESFEVYRPIEPDSDAKALQTKFADIAGQLISQCKELDTDQTGKLPKPSVLASSVAAVASAVFLDDEDPINWFWPQRGKMAAIDGLRYKYLESVLSYCRKSERHSQRKYDTNQGKGTNRT